MQLGLGLPVSGAWATPAAMRRVATLGEELGYSTLWSFQRLLHPVDQDWGRVYHAVVDPVTALSYVAGVTSRIRLGTAIVNLPYYTPIVLSKMLTTLDIVSAGRLDVGLGLGWAPEEFAAVRVPQQARGTRAEEFIACLQATWAPGEVEFHGTYYDVPRSRVDPKPVQQPHPPLLLGGTADVALRRAGRIADGWISSSRADLRSIGTSITTVRTAARDAGRDPDALRFVVRGVVRLTTKDTAADRKLLQGSADQVRSDLDQLAGAGATEVFLDLNWDPRTVSDDVDEAGGLANAERTIVALAPH